jgi:TonB family protein
MTALLSWMPPDAASGLGWTLVHFLWQGFALAALLHICLPLCRSAESRHACALVTLVLMALTPILTFAVIHDVTRGGAGVFPAGAPESGWMNGLVVLWLGGIAALSLRARGGWYLAGSRARRDTLAVPAALAARCQYLRQRMALTGPVRFLLSRRIAAPVVVGWLRPVVLIPLSAASGLAPAQLDALILHELAHIRRLDTGINLLLIAVETLLFYHPAVWWVGRQLRIEREHCCDDLAVAVCGDAAMYVEALMLLEPQGYGMALAANGGSLKHRAARLLDGANTGPRRPSLPAVTTLALLGLLAGSVAMAQAPAQATGGYLSDDRRPVMLYPIADTHTLPPYPKESVHLKEQGQVKLAVVIGKDGAVSRASLAEPSGHPLLDTAALQFVKDHWRWQPATRAGKPVTASTKVSVLFNLKPPQPAQAR